MNGNFVTRFATLALTLLPATIGAQDAAPVTKAFRDNARQMGRQIVVAAAAMPTNLYVFRLPQSPLSYGDILRALVGQTNDFCSSFLNVRTPAGAGVPDTAGKSLLITRVGDAFQRCDQLLSTLNDTNLGAHYAGPKWMTRAAAMLQMTMLWSDAYGQLAIGLRLNGRVPPMPCLGEGVTAMGCTTGVPICRASRGVSGRGYLPPGSTFTLLDSPYSVTSDGLGPYIAGPLNGHLRINVSRVASLEFAADPADGSVVRSVKVDLNHPVPGDIGVPLGVVTSNRNMEFAAQWYTDSNHVTHGLRDIPIGTTVNAEQVDIGVYIDGVFHILQMGPQRYGHCGSDGSATFGDGTTRATIHRAGETEWVVDLPPGSIGRLFDIHLSAPNAINKGLYYVSLHYVIKQAN